MSEAGVRIERRDALGCVTLDRPPLNIVTVDMLRRLGDAFTELGADQGLRVILLDAGGDQFSAGVDIADHRPERIPKMIEALEHCFFAMEALPQPLVASVNGAALGGGCELMLAADLCLASARSSFALPEIKLGHFAPPASVLLPRRIGISRALDMLLSGRRVGTAEALQIGLVNAVFPDSEHLARVEERLTELLELPGAALRLAKRAAREGCEGTVRSALTHVNRLYAEQLIPTEDASEGVEAFLARRRPRWRHR